MRATGVRVNLDAHEVLRADHDLRFWNIPFLRLHYRMEKAEAVPTSAPPIPSLASRS